MLGPGEYVPDVTEGITSVEDLPEPRLERRSRNYPARRCWHCGRRARRYSVGSRTLHDLGDTRAGRPVDLVVTYSQHYCRFCDCHFAVDLSDLAWPKCHYTRRVQELAVRVVAEDGLAYQAASWGLWRDHRVFVPLGHHPELGRGGRVKKRKYSISTTYLDEALWPISPAIWPSTRCTTGHSACPTWWTIAATTAWPSASWSTTRAKRTSAHS